MFVFGVTWASDDWLTGLWLWWCFESPLNFCWVVVLSLPSLLLSNWQWRIIVFSRDLMLLIKLSSPLIFLSSSILSWTSRTGVSWSSSGESFSLIRFWGLGKPSCGVFCRQEICSNKASDSSESGRERLELLLSSSAASSASRNSGNWRLDCDRGLDLTWKVELMPLKWRQNWWWRRWWWCGWSQMAGSWERDVCSWQERRSFERVDDVLRSLSLVLLLFEESKYGQSS